MPFSPLPAFLIYPEAQAWRPASINLGAQAARLHLPFYYDAMSLS